MATAHTTRPLERGLEISRETACSLLRTTDEDLPALLAAALAAKQRFKPDTITYSRKVFLPLTNLCRNHCDYCSFRRSPGEAGEWTMTPAEIEQQLAAARELGCAEALFCLGDKPEKAFSAYRRTLATLAAGCFWCTDAIYRDLKGVDKVESGYAGGHVPNPSYGEVCDSTTGHAEGVEITFDPSVISFHDLLVIFFTTHDPTTLNRQGADAGTQYRSAIFTHSEEQKQIPTRVSQHSIGTVAASFR